MPLNLLKVLFDKKQITLGQICVCFCLLGEGGGLLSYSLFGINIEQLIYVVNFDKIS